MPRFTFNARVSIYAPEEQTAFDAAKWWCDGAALASDDDTHLAIEPLESGAFDNATVTDEEVTI